MRLRTSDDSNDEINDSDIAALKGILNPNPKPIEITAHERKFAQTMSTLNRTGRNSKKSSFPEENMGYFNEEVTRANTVEINTNQFTLKELEAIASVYQQDLCTAPIDLILEGNPTLGSIAATEHTKLKIYKNDYDEIFADCLVSQINLTTDITDSNKTVRIPGQILFRYQWVDNNWQMNHMAVTDVRLKHLLLADYPQFDHERRIDTKLAIVQNRITALSKIDKTLRTTAQKNKMTLLSKKKHQLQTQLDISKDYTQSFIQDLANDTVTTKNVKRSTSKQYHDIQTDFAENLVPFINTETELHQLIEEAVAIFNMQGWNEQEKIHAFAMTLITHYIGLREASGNRSNPADLIQKFCRDTLYFELPLSIENIRLEDILNTREFSKICGLKYKEQLIKEQPSFIDQHPALKGMAIGSGVGVVVGAGVGTVMVIGAMAGTLPIVGIAAGIAGGFTLFGGAAGEITDRIGNHLNMTGPLGLNNPASIGSDEDSSESINFSDDEKDELLHEENRSLKTSI